MLGVGLLSYKLRMRHLAFSPAGWLDPRVT
jgi:hypothetical protein